jgi:hypothetical protein
VADFTPQICVEPKYQLIDMETQDSQGPFYNRRYHSFLDYLEKHLTYLHRKQYDFTEYWDGSLMLEIDGYKSPQ